MEEFNTFHEKRKHLQVMSDEELHNYFWDLTKKIVDPLIDMAKTHTSPSIERSILLRMGLNSMESQVIVQKCIENNLISKGAGNVLYKYAKAQKISISEAANVLISENDWFAVNELFK